MENELKQALERLEQLKKSHYYQCREDVKRIMEENNTDGDYIESTLDRLLNFYEDEQFLELFWKLINYVETFDRDIGIMYRRQEELLNRGY